MRKTFPRILLVLLVLFIGLQVVRPDMSNPASDPKLAVGVASAVPPDAHVTAILERSCYDCHSNQVRWPWYSQIAPISWTVAHDVDEARENLNFSTWGSYSTEDKLDILEELCEEVSEGKMPPGNYLLIHGDADLSEADRQTLCAWASRESVGLGGGSNVREEK